MSLEGNCELMGSLGVDELKRVIDRAKKIESYGGSFGTAIIESLPDVIDKFATQTYEILGDYSKYLESSPRASATRDVSTILHKLSDRCDSVILGRMEFRTRAEDYRVYVGVTAYKGNPIRFVFNRSPESVATEFKGHLALVALSS
ncbi:MAG: hypothetical protein AABW79_03730 [Nanoarchaeota archaeon]